MPDEKVIDTFIDLMESIYPDENLFLIMKDERSVSYVKSKKNVICATTSSGKFVEIIKNVNSFDEVIIHGILADKNFLKIKHDKISWVIWGADLYEVLLYPRGYRLYFDDYAQWRVRAKRLPLRLYKFLCGIRDVRRYNISQLMLHKISKFYAIEPDYEILCKYFPECKTRTVEGLYYYPIEKMLPADRICDFVTGQSVWINNCAKQNGNHLMVFEQLAKTKYKGTKVYCPLSYGDSRFRQLFRNEGYAIFGEDFIPLLNFIPRETYYNFFYDVNAFIYGHLRSCAEGNILVALYVGGKCFLYKDNPLYGYFKELGCVIFSIDEELTTENLYSPLSIESKLKNREIINNISSERSILNHIRDLFAK